MSHDWNSLGALDLSLSARRASRPRARLSGQGHQPPLPSSIINPVEVTTPQHDGETYVADGRVEDGRGGLGLWPSPRFPSPLIKPDVPISGIRLSGWLHREARDGATRGRRWRHRTPSSR